jgi:hypothetical protein
MTVDDILARVRRFREAARRAVHADASFKDRCLALLEIADMARDESDPVVKLWSERVIWQEAAGLLGMADDEPEVPPRSYEGRARELRRTGLVACPKCLHPLPTDEELDLWARRRRDHAELLEAREGAIGR